MKLSFKNPLIRFLGLALLLFVVWNLLYVQWLEPLGTIDVLAIDNLAWLSSTVLELFGFTLITDNFPDSIQTVGIDGTNGLWIGAPCNGISLFALFTGFVLSYPGPIKKKVWFIPLGILIIHIVNLFRIVCLLLIVYYFPDPDVLDFNHNYTFTVLVYSVIFYLWYVWAEKLSGVRLSPPKTVKETV